MTDPKFIVDEMLGTLVQWLRILGFDVVYAQDLGNSARNDLDTILLEKANTANRALLTKDEELAKRAEKHGLPVLLLTADDVKSNLKRVVSEFNLKVSEEKAGERCPVCNSALEEVRKEKVKGEVPTRVWKSKDHYWRCMNCGKVYWVGSHWDRISKMISELDDEKVNT